ncbi:alkaline phosphatase D family protein [Pseudomonas sp. LABIM340]|uniref:alkaline phosphatase D family protein n=1 Tax=Pseudomonas sp. LABIM340 TaxID=3156585 RepID=UPI0032AFDB95
MKLNQPTVGPIVGHTSTDLVRIFLRGSQEREGDGFRRCFAILRWRPAGGNWSKPLFNKLTLNFDFTGVLVPQGLTPATRYEYQACWFFAETELESLPAIDEKTFEWPTPEDGLYDSFTTSPANDLAPRRYAVGSCRYLLRLFEQTLFDDRGDKLFRSILEKRKNEPVDGLMMIGDQIYADDLNFIAPDTTILQYLERYRSVFSQPYIRKLMANVPTYMILDDHEIEDNWPKGAKRKSATTLFTNAMYAYQIYQCSHSPLLNVTPDGRLDGIPRRYWYSFSDGCADWFVMDSRTERVIAPDDPSRHQMISQTQMKALLDWLDDQSARVKLVVTSVPIFPDMAAENDDKWGGFQAQRQTILEHIRTKGIRKVVFVSGDVHCSFAGRLELKNDSSFAVHFVVSSSFYWPTAHMQEHQFAFGSALQGTAPQQYVSKRLTQVHSDDNYARLEVSPTDLVVRYYDRKGSALEKKKITF